MNNDSQNLDRRKFLTIYESEVPVIAGISAHWGNIETGVEFFGAWSNKGLPIVQLVIGPGPQAVHQPCHYEQDLDFFCRVNNIITSEYGLEWIGGGHHHHNLGLHEPSSDDVRQVKRVTSRNGLKWWCEIITTFENSDERQSFEREEKGSLNEYSKDLKIRFNAYLYTDAPNGEKKAVPIHILQGVSPYRKVLLRNGLLSPTEIGEHVSCFSLKNIVYESLDPKKSLSQQAEGVFEFLAGQCQELPTEAQDGISFNDEPDSVIVSLPLLDNGIAYLKYDKETPYRITDMKVIRDHVKIDDLLKDSNSKQEDITLKKIYQVLTIPQIQSTGKRSSLSKMKVLFDSASNITSACVKRIRHKNYGERKNVHCRTMESH